MKNVMLFLLVLTTCTGVSAEQDQRHKGTPSSDIPAFVQRLDSLRKAADIPGLSVAVVKNQAVVLALGLGYADATSTPGNQFSYNPVLYSWASRPIMAAADTPFSALVERYVVAPAGMTRSARKHRDLPLREDLANLLAPPHRVGPSGAIEQR